MRRGHRGVMKIPGNSCQLCAFSKFLAKSESVSSGLWLDSTSSWPPYYPALCPGASHLQFAHLNRGTCSMGSLKRLPVINIKSLITFHGQFFPFSSKMCSWKKNVYVPSLGKKKYLGVIYWYSSIIKISQKDLGSKEQSNCRVSKKHSPCVVGSRDQGRFI